MGREDRGWIFFFFGGDGDFEVKFMVLLEIFLG
jgi:hypothetical protein